MALRAETISILKGQDLFAVAEQVRICPAPKMGGVAGPQIRFLSASRDRSTITDLELGSHTVQRRLTGLPLSHRLWSAKDGEGYSLGYTKRKRIGSPSELFFLDSAGKLTARGTLPDAVSEVAAAPGCWYVGCRDGALYAFADDGRLLWRHAIACASRRGCSLTSMLLDQYTQPYLHVGVAGVLAIVAESDHLFAVDSSGRRVWSTSLPEVANQSGASAPGALPTRDELLHKLGFDRDCYQPEIMTGYLRLRLDTLMNGGLLKQVEMYDPKDDSGDCEELDAEVGLEIDMRGRRSDCQALACSPWWIAAGTAEGTMHVFDTNASCRQSFQVGDAPVSCVVADHNGVRAAYAGGLLGLFRGGRMTGSVRLPEYFADLAVCGENVLVWRWNAAWLVDETGKVVWAANTGRRIGSAIGEASGFHLLAGGFTTIRPVVSTHRAV